MEGLAQKVQPSLELKDLCLSCIECDLVVDWEKKPYYLALIKPQVNNYGLVFFTVPEPESTVRKPVPRFGIPVDESFKYMISNVLSSTPGQTVQLHLTSRSRNYTVETQRGYLLDQFMKHMSLLYPGSRASRSFNWLSNYVVMETDSPVQVHSPWTELKKPESLDAADYTPIAFHADADILSFDPLAPVASEVAGDKPVRHVDDLLGEYEDILSPVEASTAHPFAEFDPFPSVPGPARAATKATVPPGSSLKPAAAAEESPASLPTRSSEYGDTAYDVVDSFDVSKAQGGSVSPSVFPHAGRTSSFSKGMRARETYIKMHMASREKEFTEQFPFTVLAGTWNVNGQVASESIAPWLQYDPDPPDVIAVGFQELDLSAEALVFNDSSREDSWLKAIEHALPRSADYTKLRHIRLVGMLLVVYVQSKHMMQVYDAVAETNATGIMGMMGNKGGVAIRFQLHNSTICFVNTHLAAHLLEFERRNQDFREVYNKLLFSDFQPPLTIGQHDMVFWLGDLNYRFDELDSDQVKLLSEKREFEKLFRHDQLHKQMQLKKAFVGFTEGPLTFSPTYKYDPGTDNWDTSEKGRAPAWCDRILWKGSCIQQLAYRSHIDLRLSDHKPVSALFSVGIKVVDRTREKKVFEETIWRLDKRENESLPQVKLGRHEFYFDNVQFMEEKVESLHVANIGQSPVTFEFVAKLDEEDVCKPWLKISPTAGFIMPGDVQEISMTVFIDKLSAPVVTVGNCKLDDILVLHLVDGKDFFVPINGSYVPSVFGSSIEALVRMYGPIRLMPMDKLMQLESVASSFDSPNSAFADIEPLEIPKELWLLVDHLYKHGMTQENILIQSGVDEDIVKIRHHLDSGLGGKLPGGIFSIGEALLLFLEALPEPVVPYKFHPRCLEACNNYVLCKQVINQLPECHANVFRYLTAFLREMLRCSAENKLDAKVLAAVFGSILLRSPLDQSKSQNHRTQALIANKKARFVHHFLVNDFRD